MSVVATFVYCENSVPLARVDRVWPGRNGRSKDFFPYLALPGGGFAKKAGLNGLQLPLYRIDEVRDAIEAREAVFLVEGEGKGDDLLEALRNAGSAAAITTLFGGANAPLTNAHLASLAGSTSVVVLADSDNAGRNAGATRAQRIVTAYPGCDVRIIDLYAERDDGSDVADWLGEGHTIAQLLDLIGSATRVNAAPSSSPVAASTLSVGTSVGTFWTLRSAAEIVREGVPPVEWDIDTLLPIEDGPGLMFGPPGALKSWIALLVTGCCSTGDPFLGHFAVRRRPHAIYVNFDAGSRALERRVVRSGFPVANLKFVSPDGYDASALRLVFEQHPGAFIVVDTLSDMYNFNRGDDPALAMRNFIRELRALYQEHGANGLILDHPHRPREGAAHGDYYGSIQKEAAARIMWHVTPLPSTEQGVACARITCRKMSEGEPFPPFAARFDFKNEIVVATYDGPMTETTSGTRSSADAEIIAQVLRGVTCGMSRPELELRTTLSRDRVLAAVKAPGIVSRGKGKALRYSMREPSVLPNDSPDDSEGWGNNRPESSSPLGRRTSPNDSGSAFASEEPYAGPEDMAGDPAVVTPTSEDRGNAPNAEELDDEREEVDPDALFQYADERTIERPAPPTQLHQEDLFAHDDGNEREETER